MRRWIRSIPGQLAAAVLALAAFALIQLLLSYFS